MQTNDFEKNVQQQMEKFSLFPNDDVWLKVEERIKKEKKRRRVFFLWLFAGLLLVSAGGIRWYTKGSLNGDYLTNPASGKNAHQTNEVKSAAKDERNMTVRITPDEKHQKPGLSLASETPQRAQSRHTEPVSYKIKHRSTTRATRKLTNNSAGSGPQNEAVAKAMQGSLNKATGILSKPDSFLPATADKYNPVITKPDEGLLTREKGSPSISAFKTDTLSAESSGNEKANTVEKSTPGKPVNAVAHEKAKRKSRWSFGLSIVAGSSDNVNGVSILPNAKAADVYASPPQFGSSPGVVPQQVVSYKSSLSFGGGVFVKRSLSKRWGLLAGIDYHFYGVKTSVGQKVDSVRVFSDAMLNNTVAVGSFYRAGQSVSEKSSYHFIEFPVRVQLSINKKETHSLDFLAGIAPGLLTRSNALYFNRTTGTFYKETNQFKSFQVALNGGFMYGLFTASKYKVAIGPVIQYGLTNLTTTAARTDEHLFFAGFKANLTFKK